jgi:hypothetical protein
LSAPWGVSIKSRSDREWSALDNPLGTCLLHCTGGAGRLSCLLPVTFAFLMSVIGLYVAQIGNSIIRPKVDLAHAGGVTAVVCFVAGLVIYRYREKIPSSGLLCLIMAALSLWLTTVVNGMRFAPVPMSYVAIYLGLLNPTRTFASTILRATSACAVVGFSTSHQPPGADRDHRGTRNCQKEIPVPFTKSRVNRKDRLLDRKSIKIQTIRIIAAKNDFVSARLPLRASPSLILTRLWWE